VEITYGLDLWRCAGVADTLRTRPYTGSTHAFNRIFMYTVTQDSKKKKKNNHNKSMSISFASQQLYFTLVTEVKLQILVCSSMSIVMLHYSSMFAPKHLLSKTCSSTPNYIH